MAWRRRLLFASGAAWQRGIAFWGIMALCAVLTQTEAAQQAAASGKRLQVTVSQTFDQNLVPKRMRCFFLLVLRNI